MVICNCAEVVVSEINLVSFLVGSAKKDKATWKIKTGQTERPVTVNVL